MEINKQFRPLTACNKEGSVILIVVMVMLIITLIGIASLNTTDTDFKITRNDRCFKQNMFRAEAAALEAGQIMEEDTDAVANLDPDTTPYDWLGDGSDFDPLEDEWDYEQTPNSSYSAVDFDSENLKGYTVVYEGVATGSSLDMSNTTNLWQYSIYGRSEQCGGRVDVIVGYKKRY